MQETEKTRTVVTRFYDAFSRLDPEGMAECYASDVFFSDPVFPNLRGDQAKQMWKVLCARAKEMKVIYQVLEVSGSTAKVHWEAWYQFTQTGRQVHNRIDALLEVENDKIVRHLDHFSLWCWARQAFGIKGFLLGWAPFFKNKVQSQASRSIFKT